MRRPGLDDVGAYLLSIPGALGIGLILAAAGLYRVRGTRWATLLGAWALLPALISLVGSVWKPMFLDRYLIVSTPAFAVLGAIALVTLARRVRIAAIAALVTGTLVGLAYVYAPSGGDNWKGENWRAATQYVEHRAIVVPGWASPAFFYYGGQVVQSGWVLERAEYRDEYVKADDVRATFGDRLRARRPG
jgi:hypothetical protein